MEAYNNSSNSNNMSNPPYIENPIPYETMSSTEYMRGHPAYAFQEPINTYNHGEEISFVSPSIGPGSRHSYSSMYDESFQEVPESAHERSSPEAPSIERGNKLLSFQPPTSNHAVLDYSMRQTPVSLAAQLHGMFFLAESSRTSTGELISSPAELTCYRRNLFQITGSVTLPRTMQYAVTERGERVPIVSQELTISATESVEGSPVKIISVPWKTPVTGTPQSAEDKTEKEPSFIALDQSATHDGDAEFSVFPIAWKRLQFRVATANNGRRKELQQHFTIKLSIVATLSTGAKLSLCDALSGPIIVRGRSPRNFQQRKDVPLSGSSASMRKNVSSVTPGIRRAATVGSTRPTPKLDTRPDILYSLSPTDALRRGTSPSGYEWQSATSVGSDSGHPMSATTRHPLTAPVSPYMHPSPDLAMPRHSPLKRKSEDSPPMQLAVPHSDPYSLRKSAPPAERPRKMSRSRGNTVSGATTAAYVPAITSSVPTSSFTFSTSLPPPNLFTTLPKITTGESTELLNEYFPMGMDEWPISGESLYRPHAHIPPVTSVGGPALGGRGGYFGDDMT